MEEDLLDVHGQSLGVVPLQRASPADFFLPTSTFRSRLGKFRNLCLYRMHDDKPELSRRSCGEPKGPLGELKRKAASRML